MQSVQALRHKTQTAMLLTCEHYVLMICFNKPVRDHQTCQKSNFMFSEDDFNFPIVNFPFLSSNIPSAPAYGVYVSQLIRYARTCSNYQDFMERGKVLTTKLLSQGYQKTKLVATLKKFYGRHHHLVNPYNVSVSRIVSDVFASDAP